MATQRRGRTPIARRRLTERGAGRPAMQYRQTRAAIALSLFLMLFCGLWVIDGDFTADLVHGLTGWEYSTGWAIHILISLVQAAPALLADYIALAPKPVKITIWLISLPFGVFNVLSSAIGVAPWLLWTHADQFWQSIQNTAAGELIAFLPERMIVWLFLALIVVLRGNK